MNESPEEQARRLLKEWPHWQHLMPDEQDDLVRRLVPVFARAEALPEDRIEYRIFNLENACEHLQAKLEHAEAAVSQQEALLRVLRGTNQRLAEEKERAEAERDGVKEDLAIAARQVVLAAKNQSAAEATVARLKEGVQGIREYVNEYGCPYCGDCGSVLHDPQGDCPIRATLAATEEKPHDRN